MKSLIILKGLVKSEKLRWVKTEGLENYFIDIDSLRRMYSNPELIQPDYEILGRSFGDVVYQRFLEILIMRLSKGCLVVIDPENDGGSIFETLATIFGYTVFYVIQDIPQDYLSRGRKYGIPYYSIKRKQELEKEVSDFLNLQLSEKIKIKKYKDVLDYWKTEPLHIRPDMKVLHVSDVHSNTNLLPNDFDGFDLVIFHGDYIDGPEIGGSRKLIDTILSCSDSKFVWLEGNHELRLRKYLGSRVLKSEGRREIPDLLIRLLPQPFFETTAKEFDDLGANECRNYLERLNQILKLSVILESGNRKYICTHSGIRYKEQLDPRYIGSVVYGTRDMNRYDHSFSDHYKDTEYWSVHAHCKYPDSWEIDRYDHVINLDPPSENEIVLGIQQNNNWNYVKKEIQNQS